MDFVQQVLSYVVVLGWCALVIIIPQKTNLYSQWIIIVSSSGGLDSRPTNDLKFYKYRIKGKRAVAYGVACRICRITPSVKFYHFQKTRSQYFDTRYFPEMSRQYKIAHRYNNSTKLQAAEAYLWIDEDSIK